MRIHLANRRRGISPVAVTAALSIAALGVLAGLTLWLRPDVRRWPQPADELRIYCASGVAGPIQQALEAYQQQSSQRVALVRTGGSGRLFGQIQTEYETGMLRGADLFVTADAELCERGLASGAIDQHFPLADQRAVIAAHVDSGIHVADLRQLVDAVDISFGIANAQAAIGRQVRSAAQQQGVLGELLKRRKVETENVMQLAQALQSKVIDAAVVWDSTVAQINQQSEKPMLHIVAPIDATNGAARSGQISVGVVQTTPERQAAAADVARFLAAAEGGLPFLERAGFRVADQLPVREDR